MKPTRSVLVLMAAALGSCQAPQPPPVQQGAVKLSLSDSAAYLDRLSSRPTVSQAEAVQGILMVLGEKKDLSFAEAVGLLRSRRIADPAWTFQPDRAVTRGQVAYMVYQGLALRGGLTLTVLGPSQRYCLRELQYRGLMSAGVPYNIVTGMEYVAVLTRADELRQTGKVSEVLIYQETGQP
jgi:hypothetical protein